MSKDIRQYLHYYIGQKYRCRYVDWEPEHWTVWDTLKLDRLMSLEDISIDGIQLALRKLEDMTEEGMEDVWLIIFGRPFPNYGNILFLDKNMRKPSRWMMTADPDRLIIQWNGEFLASTRFGRDNYEFNAHYVTHYLLSKGFDLFGLISAGLAIDSATLTNK